MQFVRTGPFSDYCSCLFHLFYGPGKCRSGYTERICQFLLCMRNGESAGSIVVFLFHKIGLQFAFYGPELK